MAAVLPDPEAAADLASRICDVFAEPFELGDELISVRASVGLATGRDAADDSGLLHAADLGALRGEGGGSQRLGGLPTRAGRDGPRGPGAGRAPRRAVRWRGRGLGQQPLPRAGRGLAAGRRGGVGGSDRGGLAGRGRPARRAGGGGPDRAARHGLRGPRRHGRAGNPSPSGDRGRPVAAARGDRSPHGLGTHRSGRGQLDTGPLGRRAGRSVHLAAAERPLGRGRARRGPSSWRPSRRPP